MFSHMQGFKQLKVIRGGKNTSAFVEFETTDTAAAAHNQQQVLQKVSPAYEVVMIEWRFCSIAECLRVC